MPARATTEKCSNGHPCAPDNTYTSPTTGYTQCRACRREADRRRSANLKRIKWRKEYSHREGPAYFQKNKEHLRMLRRRNWRRMKLAAFDHYGGRRCLCCGEDDVRFLTLDHVNGDGKAHRKRIMEHDKGSFGGANFYRWLEINNYPRRPKLQVLCFNCNCGRHSNRGVCPHKVKDDLT